MSDKLGENVTDYDLGHSANPFQAHEIGTSRSKLMSLKGGNPILEQFLSHNYALKTGKNVNV